MNISIVGSGYIGTMVATCLTDYGHKVTNVDIDEDRIWYNLSLLEVAPKSTTNSPNACLIPSNPTLIPRASTWTSSRGKHAMTRSVLLSRIAVLVTSVRGSPPRFGWITEFLPVISGPARNTTF